LGGAASLRGARAPVQSTTNLLTSWSTLGNVASDRTNFAFTNWNIGPQQFYRLLVP
jgi:endonuclease I